MLLDEYAVQVVPIPKGPKDLIIMYFFADSSFIG